MPIPFSRTTRSLTHDTSRFALFAWGLFAVLLGAWLSWFTLVKVTLYEVSQTARVEVEQAAHPVAVRIAGTILSTSMRLGKQVEAGEKLIELDAHTERLRLEEEEARITAIPPQLAALTRQIADEERAAVQSRGASASGLEQAQARYREALSTASFAKDQARRMAQLLSGSIISEVDFLRTKTEAEKAQAVADALLHEIHRLTSDASSKAHEKHAVVEALKREVASLEGQRDLSTATVARLKQDIEKHVIRAPVPGVLGEVAPLNVGAFVETGAVVGSVVPLGDLKIVAEFSPARVLGRMHPGQPARVRLDGYPWAQYGSIVAKVARVASEIRAGRVRVELIPDSQSGFPLLLQHGLPGTVEVEIEHTTPVTLALRAVGQMLTRPAQQGGSLTVAGS
ncbi:MAG: HlyD family efflux transporter periplasmic adaptor subunit [Nitrospira sp.]|nr:HlyD family efflux transporter periplasmic adaptor subunit [Nitrospira sp.]